MNLKRLTRRRRRLVNERVRVVNNLQADLQAVCLGFLEITTEASNQRFLNFFLASTHWSIGSASKNDIAENRWGRQIAGVGRKYASVIQEWQKRAHFSEEAQWVGEML